MGMSAELTCRLVPELAGCPAQAQCTISKMVEIEESRVEHLVACLKANYRTGMSFFQSQVTRSRLLKLVFHLILKKTEQEF